ncbi:hypothetical protein [Botryobacter ruber]|uniref:hypothetical protein n=1 Tax=Botryobacter ruber TaxID=2171629 RepID=UPI000E0C454A|nr:hypothetical protein [Botryobacter ruber]
MVKQILKKVLHKLRPETDTRFHSYCATLEKLVNYRNAIAQPIEEGTTVSIIIFSKDRAIQLHALLSSFFELVTGQATIRVLYTVSDAAHGHAYEQVAALFRNHPVTFEKENSFRKDLLKLLDTINTEKLFFLVDDIVFTEPFDLTEFVKFNPDYFVPTLRLGLNLNFSYTLQQRQPLPSFRTHMAAGSEWLMWQWKDGALDWGYPLSVDGHLFRTAEIKIIIQNCQFRAPNSLEEALQDYMPVYAERLGIACKKSLIMNIPCNKVQLENNNIAGNLSSQELLLQWQAGFQLDFRKLRHFKNTSAHQEVELTFIKRSNFA